MTRGFSVICAAFFISIASVCIATLVVTFLLMDRGMVWQPITVLVLGTIMSETMCKISVSTSTKSEGRAPES